MGGIILLYHLTIEFLTRRIRLFLQLVQFRFELILGIISQTRLQTFCQMTREQRRLLHVYIGVDTTQHFVHNVHIPNFVVTFVRSFQPSGVNCHQSLSLQKPPNPLIILWNEITQLVQVGSQGVTKSHIDRDCTRACTPCLPYLRQNLPGEDRRQSTGIPRDPL